MQAFRRAKLADAGGGAGGRDRLSELPDCLLHVILSHLKARQVVRTCVLSRRWQHLWLASLCLDVDIGEFLPHAALHPTPRERPNHAAVLSAIDRLAAGYASLVPLPPRQNIAQEEEYYEFEDFVDCLLVHRSAGSRPPLDTLRLSIIPRRPSVPSLFGSSSETKQTSWVRRGLRCSPAALEVIGFVKLPPLASASTHRLKKLRLHWVILHPSFGEHLKSGLPVLEGLEISGTQLTGLSTIASRTLKNLVVDSSSDVPMNAGGWLMFTIAAPRLESLHLTVQFLHLSRFDIVVHEAPRLERASIRLADKPELRHRQGDFYDGQDDRALVTSMCKLLDSLSHVRALELYGFHDMTVDQQHIPFIPPLPPGAPWMQPDNFMEQQYIPPPGPAIRPHNFMQQQYISNNFMQQQYIPPPGPPIGPHNFMQQQYIPPPGPGIGPHNYQQLHDHLWNLHQPPMPPPLRRPMLQAILEVEEEHVGLLVFPGLTTLVLDECETGHEVQTLWRFLHNAPALEKLTLKNCQFQMFPNNSELETIPETATVSPTLKSVEIIYDDRDDDQDGGQYKVQINEVSSSIIKWKLPASTMIRVTKLPKH